MGVTVKVTDKGGSGITVSLKNLSQAFTAGVHDDTGTYPSGETVATVASAHEYGDPRLEPPLPQRSWLRGWFTSGGDKLVMDLGTEQIGRVVDGAPADTVSEKVGDFVVAGVSKRIERGTDLKALAASTKANPKRDARYIPLDSTGKLLESIAWKPS